MSERARLIYTGSVIVDLVLTVTALPERGGDTIASSSEMTAGGGFNVMVAAQRDGLEVVFTGLYGTGPFGTIVRAALAESGVEVVQPGLAERDSGYCVALVEESTERTFVTSLGAEGHLTRADLDRVLVRDADIVYVSGYSLAHPVNASALPGWLESLPPAVRVITDPSPLIGDLDPDVLRRVYRRTHVLSASAREAKIASGLTEPGQSAEWLVAQIRPAGVVVVRDGAAGCWLAGDRVAGTPVHVPGFAVRAVDTNGAGDAHGGVLAAALARNLTPEQAARRANAAAALAVTLPGPATAPTSAEIDELIRSSNR